MEFRRLGPSIPRPRQSCGLQNIESPDPQGTSPFPVSIDLAGDHRLPSDFPPMQTWSKKNTSPPCAYDGNLMQCHEAPSDRRRYQQYILLLQTIVTPLRTVAVATYHNRTPSSTTARTPRGYYRRFLRFYFTDITKTSPVCADVYAFLH